MAYFVTLPGDEQHWLNPIFEGGVKDLSLDMRVPEGHLVRGMNLQGCFRYHIRVPPELLGSVPTRIVVKRAEQGCLPDFGLAPWGGWRLVSQDFVSIAEQLEPSAHEFLPITETVDQYGRVIDKRFFLMNILSQFNAVDTERSSVEISEKHREVIFKGKKEKFAVRGMSLVEPYILVLKRALIEGRHLWHGTTEDIYHIFFSEQLHDAVIAAGLSPLQYYRAEET